MSDKPLLEQHILERLARCQSTDDPIGEQICEAAIVGLRWKNNSSLEEWFPFTAESIARLEAECGSLRAQIKTLRNKALEEAARQAEYERDRWQSSRDPLPDDVEGGRSASTNIAAAIRALKGSADQQSASRMIGRDIHAAWRDGMIAQGRSVAKERMTWDTLTEQDRELDNGIAAALLSKLVETP